MIATGLRQAESGRDKALAQTLKAFQSIAHLGLAVAYNVLGKFKRAIAEAERTIETYDPRFPGPNTDSRVQATAELAMATWSLGYREQARQRAMEAIAMAEEISHPPVLAFALVRAATVYSLDRNWKEALALAERVIEVTADKDLPLWRSWALFLRGSVRAGMGDATDACRMMRSALAELDSRDGRHPPANTAHARAILRHTEVEAGLLRPYEAMLKVQESIDESIETGNIGLLSDLYRMMGSLQLMDGERDRASRAQAEKSFRKAIDTARKQNSKPFELRAALELSRAWQRRGKNAPARKLLSSIYRRFTEGHDGADLKAAKSLLEELR
jgi:adenylate cyclase